MADDEHTPATKSDLLGLESRLDARFETLEEKMRDMQTELLRAFGPWQQQVSIQFRELEANTGNSVTAVKERMSILERRLLEIERRLLINPPAA